MQDDGWYSSFVSKSARPWEGVQKLAQRGVVKRETFQEDSLSNEKSGTAKVSSKLQGRRYADISKPTVVRLVKSLSDVSSRQNFSKKDGPEEKSNTAYLSSDLEFEDWYKDRRDDLLRANQEPYRVYRDQLLQTESHLKRLLENANDTLVTISYLSSSFNAVETSTTEFQAQCESILADQKRTSDLADDISQNLQYYNYLEPITRRLNAPGASGMVLRGEFSDMLSNLDTCLDYMQAHPKQKEASTYASKYRLLLTRALTMVRNYFTNSLKDVSTDVQKRISDRQLNDTTMSALLYAKFRVGAPELKQLGLEIQRRSVPPPGSAPGTEGEYQGLMNELHQSYWSTRAKLLNPIIHKKLSEIAAVPSTSKDLGSFATKCIGYIRGICSDEYDLWNEWFGSETMLYEFLEALCEPLHDHLRPRIIHETKIVKLCGLCDQLQTRYFKDSDSDEESESETPKLDFGRIIQPALQDAQDRLVFLAQMELRNEIQYFKPKPEHLDYPRRASRVALSGTRITSGRKVSQGGLSPLPMNPLIVEEDGVERDVMFEPGTQEYYPTLRKAVWLLSKIYRLVHSTVFDSLAHEIVHQTAMSLNNAAAQISTRVSPTDSNLFLLSHLLVLKHHMLAFDIEYAATDIRVDFTTPLWDLRSYLLNPAKLMQAIGGGGLAPRVVTDMKDARTEVDDKLRTVIGDLVSSWGKRMMDPLFEDPIPQGEEKRGRSGKPAPPSTGDADADRTRAMRETIDREVPLIRRKVDEYIHDSRTRDMLMRAVLEDVLQRYESWLDTKGLASPTTAAARHKGKGKGREDGIWEQEVFGEWALKAFGLDGLDLGGDDDDDDDV